MPYLNWQKQNPQSGYFHQVESLATGGGGASGVGHSMMRFILQVAHVEIPSLISGIEALERETEAQGEGLSSPELRVDLPEEWILFMKVREGESRLLIAHPEPKQWVVTAALTQKHLSQVKGALQSAVPGAELLWNSLIKVSKMSNVEVIVKVQ